ncbi:MAG: class I SAM-dependent methyltransferase [bacterium]|nr:class I SAM-dependent methyltransferase [bacterium]
MLTPSDAVNDSELVIISGLTARPVTRCHLGHSAAPLHVWDKDGFGYYRCPQCGLLWVSPQLTDESVAQIYSSGFKSKHATRPRPANFLAYRPRLQRLAHYRSTGRLLDVGCFTGHFLLAAQAAGWAQVEGTEISTPAVEYARAQYGLTVHEGDLTTLNLPHDHYDAVTLSDVIEHVRDPLATIQQVHRILRPGGVLYIDTPHVTSLPYALYKQAWSVFFPWHRTYFSARNMRLALEQSGYRVRYLAAVGVLPFNRHNAWEAYQASSSVQPRVSGLKSKSFIQRYRDVLRPAWLAVKWAHEFPFHLLSRAGIHVGAKLIVYAEKR